MTESWLRESDTAGTTFEYLAEDVAFDLLADKPDVEKRKKKHKAKVERKLDNIKKGIPPSEKKRK
jgi:hypothetical protein